jgi:tetratricopeptide (TPR) repeat protein
MKKNIRTHAKKKKALALLKDNRLGEARDLYAEVCKIDPIDAESWFRLGTINIELKAMALAEACFRRVVELEPRLASAYYNLGRSLELQAKDEEAIAVYRQLLQITPHSEAYYNIATIYVSQGKFTESLEAFRQAQQIEPDNARLIAGEAGVYEKQGDYEAAYARIKPLLDAGQATPDIAMVLAAVSQRLDRRPQAIELLENQLGRHDLAGNTDVLIPLQFELARLLDAAGDYERAFHHARLGNGMTRSAFDHQAYTAYVDAIMEIFSADFMRRAPRASDRADQLIFIIGMPRSGTTLIEQILDSHPQVFGCGELPHIGNLAGRLPGPNGATQGYPQGVVYLNEQTCTEFARYYVHQVKTLSGGADFVTDKMPQNFQFLGLIALLFPGAKVIHSLRDPLDTCLSCYFQNFRFQDTTLAFSTDLANLGNYYKQYQRLMAHWRESLDIPMLEVNYETLVADQEAVTRQMVAFCGLPWDEQCLTFYKSGRAATTASYNQVRQPMYRKSVQRWKRYEQYLDPLKRALSD